MSPYRVPAPPPAEPTPPTARWAGTLLACACIAVLATDVRWLLGESQERAADDARIEELFARQRVAEVRLQEILELRDDGCRRADAPGDAERAALEVRLDEAKHRTLPRCECSGTGDPLCSEIPGQTCTP